MLDRINEEGFAPLVVSIVIIIVLSLLTIGFVNLANTNAVNAINRQLNNGAYYASETGINDAIDAINNGFNQSKSSCPPLATGTGPSSLTSNNIGPGTTYSCLLINPTPSTLFFQKVQTANPTDTLVSPSSGSLSQIEISWQASSGAEAFPSETMCANDPCLPDYTTWSNNQYAPLLRISITPFLPSNQGYTIPNDTSDTTTAFLFPSVGAKANGIPQTIPFTTSATETGGVYSGNCKTNDATINNGTNGTVPVFADCNAIFNVNTTKAFILQMQSYYRLSNVTVIGLESNKPVPLTGGQIVIDSTGDDHGVLKRIQERIPAVGLTVNTGYDLESVYPICKSFTTAPGNAALGTTGSATSTSNNCSI